ncbi:MAG: hypothetical protein IAG13_24800 [Deltaproteobacteria bacterium]|nr:hypothetical protein [Nannocystaceae bacterium]
MRESLGMSPVAVAKRSSANLDLVVDHAVMDVLRRERGEDAVMMLVVVPADEVADK